MSFIRTRTISGRQYLYEETRYREGGKVRSISRYIGKVGGKSGSADGKTGSNPLGEGEWRKHVQQRQDDQDRAYDSAIRQGEKTERLAREAEERAAAAVPTSEPAAPAVEAPSEPQGQENALSGEGEGAAG